MATDRRDLRRRGRGAGRLLWLLAAALGAGAAGCSAPGLIYTRITRPYLDDFHATPVGTRSCRMREHTVREPVTGYNASVSFTLPALIHAARRAGLERLYHADLETLSILLGIYERKTLILYGD